MTLTQRVQGLHPAPTFKNLTSNHHDRHRSRGHPLPPSIRSPASTGYMASIFNLSFLSFSSRIQKTFSFSPLTLLRRSSKSSFRVHRLPQDVLLEIFLYLDIRDLLALRATCHDICNATKHPWIWKRWLSRMTIPLPRITPSDHYSLANMEAATAEEVVARAISLDINWRSVRPKSYADGFINAFHRITHMSILPGGKYMVSSGVDHGGKHPAIIVWAFDHPHGLAVPITRQPIEIDVYALQAKYMNYGNRTTIIVAYMEQHDNYTRWKVFTIDLDHLESTRNKDLPPNSAAWKQMYKQLERPSCFLGHHKSKCRLRCLQLDEIRGHPFLTTVAGNRTILIYQIDTQAFTMMQLATLQEWEGWDHNIEAIKLLPNQGQIFVVRSVSVRYQGPPWEPQAPRYFLEAYDLPRISGDKITNAWTDRRQFLHDRPLQEWKISDNPYSESQYDKSVWSALRHGRPPPPVSIYAIKSTQDPVFVNVPKTERDKDGMYQWITLPRKTENGGWLYDMEEMKGWVQPISSQVPHQCHVLPGSHRALVYCEPYDRTPAVAGTRVSNIHSYVNSESGLGTAWTDESVAKDAKKKRRETGSVQLSLHPHLSHALKSGVSAIAFDEGLGRVCIATSKDMRLYVLDYADC